ncbi:MAG TPA: LamG domain-containing protein [Chitinophagaceae bacterium]
MPASINNGLVMYLPFNGNTQDESGYGNHAINTNATLTTDRNNNQGKAYLFNGVNAFMRVPNSASLNPDRITMMAIVKVNGFYQGKCHGNTILNKGNASANPPSSIRLGFVDEMANGFNCNSTVVDSLKQMFTADFAFNGTVDIPLKGPFIEKNKWYCITYTYDGAIAKLYIDGVVTSSRNGSGTFIPAADDLFIGKDNNSPLFPYWLNGAIDELRIYNRALNQDEVKALCSNCNDK